MIVIQIVFNLSLLVSFSIISGFAESIWSSDTLRGKILQGFIFGSVALIGLFYPFVLAPGLIFDGRSVVISLCTLFFGPLAGLISAIMTAIGRIYIGGIGAITGVSVITSSFLIGWLFHHLIQKRKIEINMKNLYFLGFIVHIAMLFLMFSLPSKLAIETLQTISATVIIFYPLATLLIGKILLYQRQNRLLIQELQEANNKFKLITDNSKDYIWMTDLNFNYLFISPSVEQIYGYTIEERINKKATDCLTPKSLEMALKIFQEELEIEAKNEAMPNRSRTIEFEEIRKDGNIVYTEAVLTFIRDENQKPIGVLGITRDITGKHKAEQAIRESEEKYRLLVSNISDFIVKLDSDLNYLYKSDSFDKFYGDKVDNSFLSIFDDKHKIQKIFEELNIYNELTYEQEIIFGNNKTVIFWKLNSILNNGQRNFICVGRDITSLKIAIDKLSESQNIFKTIFNLSPSAILLVEKDTYKIIDANNTFFNVFKLKNDIIGENIIDTNLWINVEDFNLILEIINKEGYLRNYETIVQSNLGEIRNIILSGNIINIKSKEHLLLIMYDTTERRLAEDKLKELNNELEIIVASRTEELKQALKELSTSNFELQQLNEQIQEDAKRIYKLNEELQETVVAKDKFFSIIAHDLKNPFLTLLNNSEMLLQHFDRFDEKKKKDMIARIKEASQATYNLLENLLQWSRAQMGRIIVKTEFCNINELSFKAISLLQSQANNKNIQIINKIPNDTIVLCDKEMTSTVIRNLISNAIKYSNKNSIVEIGVEEVIFKQYSNKKQPFYVIYVQDNGIGMSQEKIKKLFKITEIEQTKGTEGEIGSGLGLIIVKEFVEKQGGTIWVKSEPNKGTTFYFTLPMN